MEGAATYRSIYDLLFSLLLTYCTHIFAMAGEIKLKYLILVPLLIVTVVMLVCIIRTVSLRQPSAVDTCEAATPWHFSNRSEALQRFMEAINFETISWAPGDTNTIEIVKLHDHLVASFPEIHRSSFITKEVINSYSLLYHVTGEDETLMPYMLAAHLDVVPADKAKWTHEPFSSIIRDEYVYGRGTIDDKHNVMGIMEALEHLLSENYRPKRSFYIAFGHDEEVYGREGAKKITEHLLNKKVEVEFVLDEGLMVTDRILPGIKKPLALIGITEKGYLTLKLTVEGVSGHSSMPPSETAIGILAKALHRLETHPHTNMLGYGPEREMFRAIAPHANIFYKFIYANLWIFSPVMAMVMSWRPADNAMVRTTTAITLIQGGIKENIVPTSASATVNHRIHPSQTIAQVLKYDKVVVKDERVVFHVQEAHEAHRVSDQTSLAFTALDKTIRQVFDNVVVAPGVLTGNTDSKWYSELSQNVYRFSPSFLNSEDLKRFHGNDERILVENYFQVIHFYHHFIKNIDEMEPKDKLSHSEL